MANHLLIFIKNPQLGRVKTRLAATVGDKMALECYQRLLDFTRRISIETKAERHLFYADFIDDKDNWPADYFHKKIQIFGNLGDRMKAAFHSIFNENSQFVYQNSLVVIGSDCAELTPEILNAAFEKLKRTSFVIGPSLDGGYYLLGMNRFEPSIFDDIEWSTPSVFQKTLEKMDALGLEVSLLPTLSDIDTEADWLEFATHLH